MDYSKYGISKKKQNLRSSAKKAEKKVGFTVFRVFIICFILVAVIGVSAGIGGFRGIIDSSPELDLTAIAPKGFKSYIYSIDGQLQHEIVGTESNRIYVSIDQINENVQNAFIALEDERFRTHNGIDPRGIVRAFFVGLANGGNFTEGASTITQQLLKLTVFSGGAESNQLLRFRRKFQEQYLALELEKQLSKDEILEAYLNIINLGRSCYGVEAASNYYFNKSASELDVSEAAVLASIAQSPTNNNPVDNPETNNTRRETTINYMYDQGLIDEATRDEALADTGIYDEIAANAAAYTAEQAEVYTYYEEAAIEQVIEDLQTKAGYTREEAYNAIYSGAYKIYLAQDPDIQQVVDEAYANDSNFPNTEYLLDYSLSIYTNPDDPTDDTTINYNTDNLLEYTGGEYAFFSTKDAAMEAIQGYKDSLGIVEGETKYVESINLSPQVQSSFVVIEQSTGYVSAIIGGRGEKTVNFALNRATDSTRQPGSAFKILSTYAPALDACGDTLATTKIDENVVTKSGNVEHTIRNVDRVETKRNMTFRDAIAQSKNTVAVRTLQEDVGTDLALKYLTENFHITTMDPVNDAVAVLAIGGITNGVTNLELTAAYASIANQGQYIRPVFYSKVLDANDNVVLENSATAPEMSTAIKATTAYELTSAMEDVVNTRQGTASNFVNVPNMHIAGKTGTTDSYKDTWFVGYSPYYTAGIWFGYDNNIDPTDRSGFRLYQHEVLWGRIMTEIDSVKALEDKDFEMPDGIVEATVCKSTGLRASSSCDSITEIMAADKVPTETCTQCTAARVCTVCGGLATANSPGVRWARGSSIPSYYCTCQPQTESETQAPSADPSTPATPSDPSAGVDSAAGGTTTVTPDPGTTAAP